nr:hypothetical protein [Tanacetum cinerariifolium]
MRNRNRRSVKNKNTSGGDGFEFTFQVSNGVTREWSRTRSRSGVHLERASHHVLKFIGLESVAIGGETLIIRMSTTASDTNFLNGFYGSWRRDEFVNKPVVENCKAKSSEEEPKLVRKNDDALIIECMSDNEKEDVS